jgi:Apea-like HEPN
MSDQVNFTDDSRKELIVALERALGVAAKARSSEYGLFFQLMTLRDDRNSALKELRDLQDKVVAEPTLEIFNIAFQCTCGHWESIDSRFLVLWLISRAQQVGSRQTVDDLSRYLGEKTLDVDEILAVDGFDIERNINLDNFSLVAWKDLPMSDTKFQVVVRTLGSGKNPSVVLIRRHKIERKHVRPWDSRGGSSMVSVEPALDIFRCVTAVVGTGYRLISYWFEPPEWAPWAVPRSNFGVDGTSFPSGHDLIEVAIPELLQTAASFCPLNESQRVRLRVPLDRLNRSYLANTNSVNLAIELGIALESLYAPTKLSEGIAFAVRTRAARFLGGTSGERQQTIKTLREVYDLRSRAVHSGRFDADNKNKWRDESVVRKALQEGQQLVGRSLVKVIQQGEPNWEEFDISDAKP